MHDFLEVEDLELWDIIQKVPKIHVAVDDKYIPTGSKPRKNYSAEDIK